MSIKNEYKQISDVQLFTEMTLQQLKNVDETQLVHHLLTIHFT